MIKTIIVDDEPLARSALNTLIESYCDSLEVVGTANDVLSAVKLIAKTKPDLVFLDVRMPNYNGFKLVEHFEKMDFKIIFTTAFEEYALKAQQINAIGYLLKPIDIDELIKVVNKVQLFHKKEKNELDLDWSKHLNINHEASTIVVPKTSGIIHLNFDDILYINSKGRDSIFHCKDDKTFTSNVNLKTCEKLLSKTCFLRIHKSIIVNVSHMKRYSKGRDSYVILYNDEMLDVGKAFKEKLNTITSYFPR